MKQNNVSIELLQNTAFLSEAGQIVKYRKGWKVVG